MMRFILALTLVYLAGCAGPQRVIVRDCHGLSRGFMNCELFSEVE